MPEETYLGDGLYASFDGWQIVLRAPRAEGDHWVGLEPEVYAALTRFVAGLNPNETSLNLSERDSAAFVGSILDPPEPNDALKRAAAAYKKTQEQPE